MHSEFTNDPEIVQLTIKASELRESGRKFSDVTDDRGHQYVDLVQEGGAVLVSPLSDTPIFSRRPVSDFSAWPGHLPEQLTPC